MVQGVELLIRRVQVRIAAGELIFLLFHFSSIFFLLLSGISFHLRIPVSEQKTFCVYTQGCYLLVRFNTLKSLYETEVFCDIFPDILRVLAKKSEIRFRRFFFETVYKWLFYNLIA